MPATITPGNYLVLNQPGGTPYRRISFDGSSYPVHALVQSNQTDQAVLVGHANPLKTEVTNQPEPVAEFTTVLQSFNFTSTTSANIFFHNENRKGFIITNKGPGTLYLLFTSMADSTLASTDNYIIALSPNETYRDQYKFIGVVKGIFGSAGTARCQEFTDEEDNPIA